MNEVRTLPEPHRYAVCSDVGMPIKEFYKNVFEEVYIFYHPFIKPVRLDYELFYPDTYPGKREIVEHCEKVSWQEFMGISGLSNVKEVDIALRTIILGLNKKYERKDWAKVMMDVCDEKKIVFPSEGVFPDLLMDDLLGSIKKEGYDWIWCGDEFCRERKLEYIDDCCKDDGTILHRECRNLFTHNQKILVTTHWDSHFSMICSDKETLNRIVEASKLEGFYCDEETEIYWSVKKE